MYENWFSPLFVRWAEGHSMLPDDLMFTPSEAVNLLQEEIVFSDTQLANASHLPQNKRYLGSYIGFYGAEDITDQDLCEMGADAGYDVIILTHVPGPHQVATEILDVRSRSQSFDNLIYITR